MHTDDSTRSRADELLDQTAEQIRHTEPSPDVVAAAADRVWNRLENELGHGGIRLVTDSTARGADTVASAPSASTRSTTGPTTPRARRSRMVAMGLAAALVLGTALALLSSGLFGGGDAARVAAIDGQLFRLAASSHVPLVAGDAVREGDVVRTGRDAGAVVELEDGSLVELRERTEMVIDDGLRGTTLRLARGSVMVEAAEQRNRHLYVATDDCLVSVVGTIFSVDHGTKGSRVAVIEGEVRVDRQGEETVLLPGDQIATRATLDSVPLADAIGWSRDVDEYLAMLEDLQDLQRDLRAVERPGLRYDSRLLDLVPDATTVYAGLPNLGETLGQSGAVLRQHLAENSTLAQYWNEAGADAFEAEIDKALALFQDLGDTLGDEVAIGFGPGEADGHGHGGTLLVLAETVDPAGLRAILEETVAEHSADGQGEIPLVFVDDPATFEAPDAWDARLYVWLGDDLAAGTSDPAQLQALAARLDGGASAFVGTSFHDSLATLYSEGAEIVFGIDLETMVGDHVAQGDEMLATDWEQDDAASSRERLALTGFDDVRHLLAVQRQVDSMIHHRAVVTFGSERHGVAAWLAEPSPMGALEFLSPDAQLVASAVLRDPAELVEDIDRLTGDLFEGEDEDGSTARSDIEERLGLSLRDDLVASLGGEITVALDGPLLPSPSWKVILEVYDAARLQFAVEQAIAVANDEIAGVGGEPIELTASSLGDLTVHTIAAPDKPQISYTFVDGYWVIAPQPALIDQALRYRASGYTLLQSPRFTSRLPVDGYNNVSALVFQDMGEILKAVTERVAQGKLDPDQARRVEAIGAEAGATLAYAYGFEDRIVVASATEDGAVSQILMQVLGLSRGGGLDGIIDLFGGAS